MSNPGKPTALVCTHNHAAQVLCDIAKLVKVRIPEDISLLLITSSMDFGEALRPPLSTLVIPTQPYARNAVKLLVDLLDHGRKTGDGGVLIRPVRRFRESMISLRKMAEASA